MRRSSAETINRFSIQLPARCRAPRDVLNQPVLAMRVAVDCAHRRPSSTRCSSRSRPRCCGVVSGAIDDAQVSRLKRLHRALDARLLTLPGTDDWTPWRRPSSWKQIRVGQNADRRGVDDDPIERGGRLREGRRRIRLGRQRAHGSASATGRQRPGSWTLNHPARLLGLGRQGFAQAEHHRQLKDVVDSERMVQIGVDEQHPALVRLAQRQGDVGRGQRLPLVGGGAADYQQFIPLAAWAWWSRAPSRRYCSFKEVGSETIGVLRVRRVEPLEAELERLFIGRRIDDRCLLRYARWFVPDDISISSRTDRRSRIGASSG